MRLAWFSPMPPMASGIADYSYEILPYIATKARVEVVCPRPGLARRALTPRGIPVMRPERFGAAASRFDAWFHHLGNNPFHEFVYEAARERPGIAVFHDAVLHHLVAHITVEQGGDPARYERILREELGDHGRRLAWLRYDGIATDYEKFVFPLTAHIARRASGVVVHSQDAADRIREQAPHVPLTVIPHHAGRPPAAVASLSREEARRRLGVPAGAFLVGHFGFVTRPKQPAAVVAGFARLHAEFPNARLAMVGADHSGGALGRMVDDLGVRGAVRIAGYVDLERMYLFLKACDAVINLRYPSAGESSGTLARSLAEGRAVIVNNYASWAELPSDVALKVEIDGPQSEQVATHLLNLARDPEMRSSYERRAREYAIANLSPERCRDLYVAFASGVVSGSLSGAPSGAASAAAGLGSGGVRGGREVPPRGSASSVTTTPQ